MIKQTRANNNKKMASLQNQKGLKKTQNNKIAPFLIKHIIFDFDDTLTLSSKEEHRRHNMIAKKLGHKPSTKNNFFSNAWGMPWETAIQNLHKNADVKAFKESYIVHFKEHTHRLVPGTKKTLQILEKNNYKIHLLTSRDSASAMVTLKQSGIHAHFDKFHTADHSKVHKPNPKVFTQFLKKHNLKKNQCMYVGDMLLDYEGASKAGLTFIAVLTGSHDKKKFLNADLDAKYIIPSVKYLPQWLKNHNSK